METGKRTARGWGLALIVATGLWVGCSPRTEIGVAEPEGQGAASGTAGSGGHAGNTSAQAGAPQASSAGSSTLGGSAAGGGSGTGGGAGGGAGSGAGGDEGNALPLDPYEARSGPFKMLVYSRTSGFRHGSIASGQAMLQEIADEQGFQVVMTETNELFTREGLNQFEIMFFLNTSGDIFNETEQATFEEWMTTRHGAFGGVHGATDTENGWGFYSEVTGQYYNGHTAVEQGEIVLEASALDHPAVAGLPNPWQRVEEWYRFDNHLQWTPKPGFQVLGRKAADGQPIAWVREWGKFRSFYTGLGHQASIFGEAAVKQHITGGIMWAVRREQLIQ